MNYPVNTKPRLSAVAIASGVLFALAAVISLIMDLINKSFANRSFFYNGLWILGVLAFVAVVVMIFARVKEVFLAIPFAILALRSITYFIAFIINFPFVECIRWFGIFRGLGYFVPDLITYFLTVISFVLIIVATVTSKIRKVISITAGVIYAVRTILVWIFFPVIDGVVWGYISFPYFISIIRDVSIIPDIFVAVAMILLGIALSRLAPDAPKYAPYGYSQRPPMPNTYTPVPPMQNNNYGYAPMQTPVQNPATVQPQPLQMQNTSPVQEANSTPVPEVPSENDVKSTEITDTEKIAEQLSAYKKMLENGLISEADFEAKKKQLLRL